MAWTAPRTWVASEVVTAAGMMNPHLTANMDVLKVSRDDLGRIRALTSSYVADLSGTSLTGLAKTASTNTFTAGRHIHTTAAKVRVPVGTDLWDDDGSGGKREGSVWVEGDYFHHIDASKQEWRYLGDVIDASAGALPGFAFIVDGRLRYTDASGKIRECKSSVTTHSDAAAVAGSAWVQSSYVHWVHQSGTSAHQGHQDISHSDHTDHTDHSDHGDAGAGHTDTAHGDHSDHVDHTDGVHVDSSPHGDTAHSDHDDHTDHTDHGDDPGHTDIATDQRPVTVP